MPFYFPYHKLSIMKQPFSVIFSTLVRLLKLLTKGVSLIVSSVQLLRRLLV